MTTAQIASIPSRGELLRQTVKSLRPQVDKIFVALNNYDYTPDYLQPGEFVHLDNSTGDAAKFYGVENLKGYLLTCDDDLIYPKGYVKYMIRGVKKYRGIATLHGKIYPRPANHFMGYKKSVACLDNQDVDIRVDVPGTGVCCIDTSMINIRYVDFKERNMADIWLAKIAQEQSVKIVALAHKADYLTYQEPGETIYIQEGWKNFEKQNNLLREIFKA